MNTDPMKELEFYSINFACQIFVWNKCKETPILPLEVFGTVSFSFGINLMIIYFSLINQSLLPRIH